MTELFYVLLRLLKAVSLTDGQETLNLPYTVVLCALHVRSCRRKVINDIFDHN